MRLEQVLVNVIQNALEAVQNTQSPRIELHVSRERESLSVTIADNGPGVPEGIKSEIFTPFFSKKTDGLGIGLGIAKDIMLEFGGSLHLVTSPLGGAAFKIRLRTYAEPE